MPSILILGDVTTLALRRQLRFPIRDLQISREQIAISAAHSDARPPHAFRKRHRLARQHEAALQAALLAHVERVL